jgi:BRCA1-associated protein
MRSYFFHLAFELYSLEGSNNDTVSSVFIPPPGSDIFESEFPEHSTIPWGSSLDETFKSVSKRISTDPLSAGRRSTLDSSKRHCGQQQGVKGSQAETRLSRAKRDWRFDPVSIVSIDMESNSKVSRPTRGKSFGHENRSKAPASGPPTRGLFIPSDPKNTDVGHGIVHLYRDVKETPGLYEETLQRQTAGSSANSGSNAKYDTNACTTLCILAVPSYMTPSDLLGYVGENTTREDVSHFRMIRTGRTNKYMVLMKFRDSKKAKEWQKEYNGKAFNSMEVCLRLLQQILYANKLSPSTAM